jgi:hypothetical protein
MRTLCTCALLLVVAGCTSAPAAGPAPASADPAAELSALEDRLLNAGTVKMSFGVTAEGVFEAELRGGLAIKPDGGIQLTGAGQFGGQAVNVLLWSEAGQCSFGDAGNPSTAPRPAALEEALLIGFTRMGILHNIARLTSARLPDRADGGVREWVVVGPFTGDPENPAVMSFDMTVDGEAVGSASLEVDEQGRPVIRRQTVRFPEGEMRVVEWYSGVTID